jgi:hypothetical protein
MTTIGEAEASLAAHLDQEAARIRDLDRLLQLLTPLRGTRGPVWLVLRRRLPPEQRAEVAELRVRLRVGR